jgi:hypothetical protein
MEDDFDAEDPNHRTYHMVDWSVTHQSPSNDSCVVCARPMRAVDPIRNKAGIAYEGRVCHSCKVVFWVRKDD